MTTQKIAISVPEETLAKARMAVKKGRAESLSAYVSRALEEKSLLEDLDALLEEMLAESGGPLTVAEKQWADAQLLGSSRKSKKKSAK